jgi:hypothetical protein
MVRSVPMSQLESSEMRQFTDAVDGVMSERWPQAAAAGDADIRRNRVARALRLPR